ncbi:hypothetical protein Tco_0326936 [Tanacetum coccineum]
MKIRTSHLLRLASSRTDEARGNEYIKNGQQRWEEREKAKPKAYSSLMGQPVPITGDDTNRHIDKFLEVTQHMLPLVTQTDTFYNGLMLRHRDTINAAAGGTFMQKTPEECYDLIKNITAHHNHWDTSAT